MLVKEVHLCTSVGSFSLQCMLLQNGTPAAVTEPLQVFHVRVNLTPVIFMCEVEKLGWGGFRGCSSDGNLMAESSFKLECLR